MERKADYKKELLTFCMSKEYSKESIYKIIELMPKPSEKNKDKILQKMISIVKTNTEEKALKEMETLL